MLTTKKQVLSGWGKTPVAKCLAWRPEKCRDLFSILTTHREHVIARGLGRSYGDAALQPEGTIHMQRFDHYIHIDAQQGIVRAQAGVTLADLMERLIPSGWMLPVIPGTRFVTLGGAFACNVHGKNHFASGDFAEHVLSVRIRLSSGEVRECSPHEHAELFWATAGGMGMTGIIEEIALKLKPISSASLVSLSHRVENIAEMVENFERHRDNADYMVGWIDHMARGEQLGRGVFEAAQHVGADEGGTPLAGFRLPKPRFGVPFTMPGFLLNRYSMAVYNFIRFGRYKNTQREETVSFAGFFHPLDGMGNWNRLYGKRGFYQYQCMIPEEGAVAKLQELLAYLHEKKLFSFLAVIKYHRDGVGYLTFSRRGYSVAFDFPNTSRVREALPELDRFVASLSGRVYLAKDAWLTPDLFHAMYGENARSWCELIESFDPTSRFASLMSERLQWKRR